MEFAGRKKIYMGSRNAAAFPIDVVGRVLKRISNTREGLHTLQERVVKISDKEIIREMTFSELEMMQRHSCLKMEADEFSQFVRCMINDYLVEYYCL